MVTTMAAVPRNPQRVWKFTESLPILLFSLRKYARGGRYHLCSVTHQLTEVGTCNTPPWFC